MTSLLWTTVAVAVSLAWAPLASAADAVAEATATLHDAKGAEVGTARVVDTPAGLLIHVDLHGLPPGERGFHVHEIGQCEPPFASAGGHLAPDKKEHGFLDEAGPHGGDLVNIVVPENGRLQAVVRAPALHLKQVLDGDGAALVIHAGPDDYKTQPSGGSGDRIACGVVGAKANVAKP